MAINKISVGSVCSGIEAASVAWKNLDFKFEWFSEIDSFPSRLLNIKFPEILNLGDMCDIPKKLQHRRIEAPDLICGGTPCQSFSFAGWKNGLREDRGNLTLKFVDIINQNDKIRKKSGLPSTIVLWENVEGILNDKTNPFGSLLGSLGGFDTKITLEKWPCAGLVRGPKRNIAWRILDAKYFGLPQQRRRLYLIAGGRDFFPEKILFDKFPSKHSVENFNKELPLVFNKKGHRIEVFRKYTDCLYSAYGTKWNGNAAAYNGSLFVSQNGRLRRFTPLECERLMGFPDNYTNILGAKPTNRYKSLGNSWAVPVIKWIGKRIAKYQSNHMDKLSSLEVNLINQIKSKEGYKMFNLSNSDQFFPIDSINGSAKPDSITFRHISNIIDIDAPEQFYISPVGCKGILRRKKERNLKINLSLEKHLQLISSLWSEKKIEEISRIQSRGKFSSLSI